MAINLRKDLGVSYRQKLDPLKISIDGVIVVTLDEIENISSKARSYLLGEGRKQWSAMSVPLDRDHQSWIIVRNHLHEKPRQHASIMEEFWHILLGHQLTKIVKIGSAFGRSFEAEEEHDAYYLAAASLVPRHIVNEFVNAGGDVDEFASSLGVSRDLVEYRIKRLGLWRKFRPKSISYSQDLEP